MLSYRDLTVEELRDALAFQKNKLESLQHSPVSKGYKEVRSQRIVTVNRMISEIKAEISSRK